MIDEKRALYIAKRAFPSYMFDKVIDFRGKYIFWGTSKKYGPLTDPAIVAVSKDAGKVSYPSIMELSLDYGDEFTKAYENARSIQ